MAEAVLAGGHEAASVMRVAAQSLRAHVDDLAGELVSLIMSNEERYARGHGAVSEADLVASCRTNLDRMLQMLAGAVPIGENPLDAAQDTGRRRAGQFLPLGALLHSYRLEGELVWRGLVREARAAQLRVTADQLVEIATRVWEVVDHTSLAATEAYRSAEWELQRRDDTRRAGVLHALLEGHVAEGSSEVLGIPPHGSYLVVVVPLSPSSAPMFAPPEGELRRRGLPSSWHPYRGMHVGLIALGHGGTEHGARGALDEVLPGPAGVSHPLNGLGEVSHGYHLALLAQRSVPEGETTIAWLDDRLSEALVASNPEVSVRLARRTVGPLLSLRPAERDALLETVEAWLQHEGSPSRVAAATFCHRNTVLKRVHRIERLTSTSLSDVADLTRWTLALCAARLFGLEDSRWPPGQDA